MALGLIFMVFAVLEAGSKIDEFAGFPGGTPELRERTSRVLESLFPGAVEDHLLCLMIHFNKTSDIRCETTGH